MERMRKSMGELLAYAEAMSGSDEEVYGSHGKSLNKWRERYPQGIGSIFITWSRVNVVILLWPKGVGAGEAKAYRYEGRHVNVMMRQMLIADKYSLEEFNGVFDILYDELEEVARKVIDGGWLGRDITVVLDLERGKIRSRGIGEFDEVSEMVSRLSDMVDGI